MEFWVVLLVVVIVVVIVVVAFLLVGAVKVLGAFERGVVFRLGRVRGEPVGPGLVLVLPLLDSVVRVDLRPATADVSVGDAETLDGVRVEAEAVVGYRVIDPVQSVLEVEDHASAILHVSRTFLRGAIHRTNVGALRGDLERTNAQLRVSIDESARPWGVKVTEVEVQEVRRMR